MHFSIRRYAKHRGVSEGAVRKAIRSGRIDLGEDGLIDPEIADRQWSANTDPSKSRSTFKTSKKKNKTFNQYQNELTDEQLEANDRAYQRAKAANEVLKAQIGKIELKILKGELIDRQKTCQKVFEISRRERDHWINWPARVSAQFAAALKLDEHFVYTILEDEIRKELFRQSKQYARVNDDAR